MSDFRGVNIIKAQGSLNRSEKNDDAVAALVAIGDFSSTSLEVGKAYELLQVEDAEAYGVDAAFDANTTSLVHNEISEFFRLAPDGILFLIPLANTTTIANMHTSLLPYLREERTIKGLGVVGASSTISTLVDEVEGVQSNLVDALFSEYRYLDYVLLEGKGDGENFATISEWPNFREKNAPQISIVAAQDPTIASIDAAYSGYASVGAALGMVAVRQVNENIGSVNILNKPITKRGNSDYPLTENNRWVTASLSTGKSISEISYTDFQALEDKGYIVAGAYAGYAGIFFNGSPTCVSKSSDYGNIENNRTWNKAARRIRLTLLPEVKGIVKRNPETGFVRSTTISRWQGVAEKPLQQMLINNEISGFEVYINPKQTLRNNENLKVQIEVVKDEIVHAFDVEVGLTNNI